MPFETLQLHAGFEPEPTTLALAGVFSEMVRLSVGLEHVAALPEGQACLEDLKAGIREALA